MENPVLIDISIHPTHKDSLPKAEAGKHWVSIRFGNNYFPAVTIFANPQEGLTKANIIDALILSLLDAKYAR